MKSRPSIFRAVLLLSLWLAMATPCRAVTIGFFDGLDKLIERADAIAIIRIDSHIDVRKTPNLSTTHQCYVYQSLKGDVPTGKTIPVRLLNTWGFGLGFEIDSVHLVFFRKLPKDADGIEYHSLDQEGAHLELSPLGNEALPPGKTLPETIALLLENYQVYRNRLSRAEDAFLQKVVGNLPRQLATNGLRLSIAMAESSTDVPAFEVALRNVGDTDVTLNLGLMLGNGKVQWPDNIGLHLTDAAGKTRELKFYDRRYPGIAGRVDDYIVYLRAGSSYTLRLRLDEFLPPAPNAGPVQPKPGERYRVSAHFKTSGVKTKNTGTESNALLNFWKGELRSNELVFAR